MFSIHDDKALGIIGMNSLFFKKIWPIAKHDIIKAIKHFFVTGVMCPEINCTSITLIPKGLHVSSISQYKPIACCIVLYKMIAKILAARMQSVMGEIIDPAQV